MTGITYEIYSESELALGYNRKCHYISIGENAILTQSPYKNLGGITAEEGYFVKNDGNIIIINGNSERGTVYGAYAFLRYLLTQSCQESMKLRLPVNDSVLQAQLAGLLKKEAITQQEIDLFDQLVDGLRTADYSTDTVEQIIREELAAYLAGDATEDETADRIQSRVYLYLQEVGGNS